MLDASPNYELVSTAGGNWDGSNLSSLTFKGTP